MRWGRQSGQVLAFLALIVPIVLLAVVAYAVDAAVVGDRRAAIESAAVEAAEAAAQELDGEGLRSDGAIRLDPGLARAVAEQMIAATAPGAVIERVTADGTLVTLECSQRVPLPLPVFAREVTVRAVVSAKLVSGYARPSSLLPLPVSSF